MRLKFWIKYKLRLNGINKYYYIITAIVNALANNIISLVIKHIMEVMENSVFILL